jgi:septal ring factor EnvC (AmiA/AmiB activator)
MGITGIKNNFRPTPALRIAAAIAVLAAVALPATVAGAQSIDELNSRIAGARDQAQALGAQIETATAELHSAQAQAIAAAQREAELSSVLARGEEREAELEAAVHDAQAKLSQARDDLNRSLRALANRLVEIYRGHMPDSTTVLLEADGWDDLATRAEYLQRVEDADAALVGRVRSLRNSVRVQLAAVEHAQARVQAFNERIAAARDQISVVRAQAESRAAALESARASQQAAVASLQGQVGDWTQRVQHLEQVSAEQAQNEVDQWFGDWAIPESIVQCESGGNFGAVNPSSGAGGAYQILPSTWDLYGGEGNPEDASPGEQSDIASQIWADSGAAAWECAQ